MLKRQPESEWASPTFIIPKKSGSVRFISDFREVNKRLVRTPYPLHKISTVLQEMEGFTYATALDLNMGYYTIRLDPDSQKICTIILPWGKYSYIRGYYPFLPATFFWIQPFRLFRLGLPFRNS